MKQVVLGFWLLVAMSQAGATEEVKTEAALIDGAVFIRSDFGVNRSLVRKIDLGANMPGGNQVVNFAGARIVARDGHIPFDRGYIVSQERDDIAPVKFNGTYIGANHGAYFATRVPTSQQLKVGGDWVDEDGARFRVVSSDAQSTTFLSTEQGEPGSWQFKLSASGDLSETGRSQSIITRDQVQAQVYPSVRRIYKSVSAGMFRTLGKEFLPVPKLTISESYDILSPVPEEGTVARITVRYVFKGNATEVDTTVRAIRELRDFSMAGTQAGPINFQNARLMQRVERGDQLSSWTDITDSPQAIRVHTPASESSQKVAWNNYRFGQTVGVASATINGRPATTAGFVDLSSARKQYPIAVEGLTMAPGDVIKVKAYRYYWPGDEPGQTN